MYRSSGIQQRIQALMISSVDKSRITTGVSVAVSIDGGTFSAGAGTLTHEGSGRWMYLPDATTEQIAEHLGIEFDATDAVPVFFNVYLNEFSAPDVRQIRLRLGLDGTQATPNWGSLGAPGSVAATGEAAGVGTAVGAVQTTVDWLKLFGRLDQVGLRLSDNGGANPPTLEVVRGDFGTSVLTLKSGEVSSFALGTWSVAGGWARDPGWDGSAVDTVFFSGELSAPLTVDSELVLRCYDDGMAKMRRYALRIPAGTPFVSVWDASGTPHRTYTSPAPLLEDCYGYRKGYGERVIRNKRPIRKDGSTWKLVCRNEEDDADILRKPLKDKDGGEISDLVAGQLAAELADEV
jgi:hypothetical protein